MAMAAVSLATCTCKFSEGTEASLCHYPGGGEWGSGNDSHNILLLFDTHTCTGPSKHDFDTTTMIFDL